MSLNTGAGDRLVFFEDDGFSSERKYGCGVSSSKFALTLGCKKYRSVVKLISRLTHGRILGGMAESADAADLKSAISNDVRVRVSLPPPVHVFYQYVYLVFCGFIHSFGTLTLTAPKRALFFNNYHF